MKIYFFLVCTIVAVGCQESKSTKIQKPDNEVLMFLRSGNYRYYGPQEKHRIPKEIVDSLSAYTNGLFTMGDLQDSTQNKKFNFLLLNDVLCLLSYSEVGANAHNVIDFWQHKGAYKHVRYNAKEPLNDTLKLKNFLLENPI